MAHEGQGGPQQRRPGGAAALAIVNAAGPALDLEPVRLAELPVELAQFADVMRRVRDRLTFDQEPSHFLRVRDNAAAAAGTGDRDEHAA